jgi:hypothetical protein
MLLGGQMLAEVSGLASGAAKPVGWRMVAVLAGRVTDPAALAGMGVRGVGLLQQLFRAPYTLAHRANKRC